jgi:hypothetical protein
MSISTRSSVIFPLESSPAYRGKDLVPVEDPVLGGEDLFQGLCGKAIIIDPFKFFEIVFNTLIILRILRLAGSVNSRCVGHVLISVKKDKELTDKLYCKFT